MTNKNKSIVILVGLPASGKSTARAKAAATGNASDSFHYSTDDEIERHAAEMESTYGEVFADYIKTATATMNQNVEQAIKDGMNVLWDQTNMSAKKRRKILARFNDEYHKQCVCILPPMNQAQEDELSRRLSSRPGKNIPAFVMTNMRNSFNLPSVNEGFNQVLYFDIYGKMVDRNVAAEMFGAA